MPIDASIPLQAKTPHFMGPQDVITLQNLAAQSQMNQLKLMQANEARQSMDALKTFYSDRNNFDEKGYVKPDRMNAMMALNPLVGEKIMDSESTRRMREAQLSTQTRLLQEADRKAREAESQRVSLAGLRGEMAKPTEEQALSAMGLVRNPPGSPHEFGIANPQSYQQAEQTPFNIGYQSPERMEQLRLGAVPLNQLGTYLKPQVQRGTVVPAGGGWIPPGGTQPTVTMPFNPRSERQPERPLPTDRGYMQRGSGNTWTPVLGPDNKPLMPSSIAGGGELSPETLNFTAKQYLAGDRQAITGYARNARARIALQNEIVAEAKRQGKTPEETAAKMADFMGIMAGARAVGTRGAQVELASTEALTMMDLVRETSSAFGRTNFMPWNKVIEQYDKGTGAPEVMAFGAAINSLINIYARAINPTGVPTQNDKEHAREMLSRVQSPQQVDAVLNIMTREMQAARQAPRTVREATRRAITGQPEKRTLPRATNPKTGETVEWDGTQWRKIQQ